MSKELEKDLSDKVNESYPYSIFGFGFSILKVAHNKSKEIGAHLNRSFEVIKVQAILCFSRFLDGHI